MNSQPPGSAHRDGGGASDGGIYRLERLFGFGEPEEHKPAAWVLLALLGVAALLISVFSLFVSPVPPGTPPHQVPFVGLFLILLMQGAGDYFYRRRRRLSALLRVGALGMVLPAVAALHAATVYSADGPWGALFVVGVFSVAMALVVLVKRVSGPRRARRPGPR